MVCRMERASSGSRACSRAISSVRCLDMPQALRRDDAELRHVGAHRVDQHRALADQQVAGAMQHQHGLLLTGPPGIRPGTAQASTLRVARANVPAGLRCHRERRTSPPRARNSSETATRARPGGTRTGRSWRPPRTSRSSVRTGPIGRWVRPGSRVPGPRQARSKGALPPPPLCRSAALGRGRAARARDRVGSPAPSLSSLISGISAPCSRMCSLAHRARPTVVAVVACGRRPPA